MQTYPVDPLEISHFRLIIFSMSATQNYSSY
jgi:hypothetical protein